MEFEFILPQKNEDLLESTGNSYCVTKIYSENELGEKLRRARLALTEGGALYIFDHFDALYSTIEIAKKVQIQTIFRAMELLYKSIDELGKNLADFLQKPNPPQNERCAMLNALKMLLFANIALIKKVEKDVIVSDGKKGKKHTEEALNQDKWDNLRNAALLQMFNVLQLPLCQLWETFVAEENFVNLCADFVYRTIELPLIKSGNVQDTCFQILGTLLKQYNHSMAFPVHIFNLMKSSEMSAKAIAEGVVVIHEHYGIQTVLKVIIEQILNGLDNDTGDGQIVKNISAFFSELGSSAPQLVMPYIREIAGDVLNLESYQLRICILQLMSEIVITELQGENLPPEKREVRDEYLDHIFCHIHDVNAHVRSKAIAIWTKMAEISAFPLSWISQVMKVVVGRLEDKSNLVRKNSILMIKAFLEHNPFAAKLPLEELEKRYEEKQKELTDLRTKLIEEADKIDTVNENWEKIVVEMKTYIVDILKLESIEDEKIRPEECENLYQQFQKLVEEKDYERLMLLVRKNEELNGNWKVITELEELHAQVYIAMLLKSYFILQSSCKDYEEDYKKAENAVRFLEDSLEFSRLLVSAVPKLQDLLMSKTDSDVAEAIDFFTSAFMFGIKNTESGMRQLLYLVWTLSKEKRGPVQDAYRKIFFTTDYQGRAHAVKATYNLMRFIENLKFSEFVAFEELVKEFVLSQDIDNQMIQVMFEIYTKKLENVTNNDSRLALQLLVICSNIKPSIARANSELLENLCFVSGEGLKDSRVFTLTLEFLMNVYADKEDELYPRYESDNEKVSSVLTMFRAYFLNDSTQCFDEVCSKTFQYIYKMCNLPNIISQDLIKELWDDLVKMSQQADVEVRMSMDCDDEPISQAPVMTQATTFSQSDTLETMLNIPVTLAARFIFMIGYVSMKELIYLDVDIFSNLKYRQELTDLKKNKKERPEVAAMRKSLANMSASAAMRKSLMPPAKEEENEEDVIGPSNDDIFAEQVNAVCEKEMMFSKESIFRRFIPLVLEILKHPNKYNFPELQRAALLALIHFMSVSSQFCDDNMPFLMNIFQRSQDIDLKCNVIIGMSDLTFRFPNVIEPWSGQLYSTLYEEDRDLRLTSVRILAHLISHEMILVKGQISDLAMCLVDKDAEIRSTTEVFFKEIANKANILYNVLPDIISRLSDPKLKLEEGKYQIIMKYIVGLINKDRQIEGLIEKLCFRFKVTEQERQWRDIAYCLSLLTYTEKTIKKLTDNIVLFKDKVQVQEVHDFFKQIISNTLKLAKPELKTVVQDFEMKLEECFEIREKTNENEDAQDTTTRKVNVPVVKRRGGGKVVKKPPPRSRRGKKPSSSEDSSSSDSETENQPPRRKKGPLQRERKIVDSDEEGEEAPKTSGRSSRYKVIQETTSSDETPSRSSKPSAKRSKK